MLFSAAGLSENPSRPRLTEGFAKPGCIKNKFEDEYE
jgi:hypothetical protein